jgi:hypothetical protein
MGCLQIVEPSPKPEGKPPGSVVGYTDKVSYSPGESMKVYLSAEENFDNGLFALYDVLGNEMDLTVAPLTIQVSNNNEPWKNGLGFQESFTYVVPDWLKSGLYFWENSIPVIIKANTQKKITIVYPSNTVNAYTQTAYRSLYSPSTPKVSFLRPQSYEQSYSMDFFKWIAKQPFDFRVIADYDLDYQSEFFDSEILIIPGHNEYWTRKARENFDAFVEKGNHALVLSGNTMWWQVRYENNSLVCYRNKDSDPISDKKLTTYLWNDLSLSYPIINSIGADFDKGGYGLKSDNGWDGYKIVNPASPLLEGVSFARGDILKLPTGEYDGAPIKGFDSNGYPIIDNDVLGFYKIELVGFDLGFRGTQTIGTFFAFQKFPTSGIVINTGSIEWCAKAGIGAADGKIKQITKNMIDKLLNKATVFSQ